MKEFEVLGGTEEDKAQGKAALRREHENNFGAVEGELVKTAKEIEYVREANSLLEQELRRLGLNNYVEIEPERVHFLNREGWGSRFSGDVAQGHDGLGGVYINEADIEEEASEVGINIELKKFVVMLHELVHLLGHEKYINIGDTTHSYRHGYETKDLSGEGFHMQMFNEAIVDTITGKLLRDYAEKIKEKFGVVIEDLDELKKYLNYFTSIALVSNMVMKVSEKEKVHHLAIWDEMMKNYFTGNMIFLRKIEKAYGPGAFRLLGMLDFKGTDDEKEHEKQTKLRKYFILETSNEERATLAKELLGDL